jgi:hypothetical protein
MIYEVRAVWTRWKDCLPCGYLDDICLVVCAAADGSNVCGGGGGAAARGAQYEKRRLRPWPTSGYTCPFSRSADPPETVRRPAVSCPPAVRRPPAGPKPSAGRPLAVRRPDLRCDAAASTCGARAARAPHWGALRRDSSAGPTLLPPGPAPAPPPARPSSAHRPLRSRSLRRLVPALNQSPLPARPSSNPPAPPPPPPTYLALAPHAPSS